MRDTLTEKTRFRLAVAAWAILCAPMGGAQDVPQLPIDRGEVASTTIPMGSFAYYVPTNPRDVIILVHGYPWPDNSRSIVQLIEHAESYVERWQPFASKEELILIAPAFGTGDFAGYRELFGRRVDADDFVTFLVDAIGHQYNDGFDGRFYLYGHSAGGQFAGRYVVKHPERIKGAVLSAPSTYPFPDPSVQWPYGMGSVFRTAEFSGTQETGKDPEKSAGTEFHPNSDGWITAATEVPIAVIVGAADTETRSEHPGQFGKTRIERAGAWVDAMRNLATSNGNAAIVSLTLIDGVAHDPVALTEPAQELLLGLKEARPN